MGWTHAICFDCWDKNNPDKKPVRVMEHEPDKCCFCGRKTIEGIFTRHDPKELKCGCDR